MTVALAPKRVVESAVRFAKEAGAGDNGGVLFEILVIKAGWGSSGYYPQEMLARDGGSVFHAGVQIYLDHPSESESWDRPERSVNDLIGTFATDASWSDEHGGLVATMEVFQSRAQAVREMMHTAGMSIAAWAEGEYGDVDGQYGMIFTKLVEARSVDVVTLPGAGGAILSVLESARKTAFTAQDQGLLKQIKESTITTPATTQVAAETGVNKMAELDKETADGLKQSLDSLTTTLTTFLTAQSDAAEADRKAREAADQPDPLDAALNVTKALSESKLPAAAQARVIEALRANPQVDLDAAIKQEQDYIDSVVKESAPAKTAAPTPPWFGGATASESATRVGGQGSFGQLDLSDTKLEAGRSRWAKGGRA